MGEVDAFKLQGLKCYFGSNDHFPQHFEVLKRGKWLIRVYFLRCTRKRGLGWESKKQWRGAEPTPVEKDRILKMVLAHKNRLLREWNEKVSVQRPNRDIQNEHEAKSGGVQHG